MKVGKLTIFVFLLVISGKALAFATLGSWLGSSANYRINATVPATWHPAINRAANTWTAVPTSAWNWNQVSFLGNVIRRRAIDGPGGTLGHAILVNVLGVIISFSMEFDTDENWHIGLGAPGSNQIDLESVAAHEFGHALGLAHTQVIHCLLINPATMCPAYPVGSISFRTLEQDDINGVSSLYPP